MTAVGAAAPLAGPALRRRTVGHVVLHAVMLVVMIAAMMPPGGPVRHLCGAIALVGLSLGLAPVARRSGRLGPLLDLWAMAAMLLVGIVGPVGPGASTAAPAPVHAGHAHGPAAVVAVVAVLGVWALARWAASGSRRRRPDWGAVVSGTELLIMAAMTASMHP